MLINVLSLQQHSKDRKCYDSHRADGEMELRKCTAKPGTEQGDEPLFLYEQPNRCSLLAVLWWPCKVYREGIHLAELRLSLLPWDLSHSSCLTFILGENPPKQQSMFEL